ncbi:unnamed protein product [Pleuronectes platessa]|uniref:Uncharacterized protein n=1 Tax=Pleuronectes platessa TaxID=8262 RepID=A0A9N7UN59_PLEPL|nr:unnamed protein product [Pleuronectes platessa]
MTLKTGSDTTRHLPASALSTLRQNRKRWLHYTETAPATTQRPSTGRQPGSHPGWRRVGSLVILSAGTSEKTSDSASNHHYIGLERYKAVAIRISSHTERMNDIPTFTASTLPVE